jgi:hypothetical protein
MEKIKDYFNRYPNSEEVYENGGVLFHNRGDADSYAKGDTKKYTRKEAEATKAAPELTKEQIVETVKTVEDLSAVPYETQKLYAKVLGLTLANKKAETLLAALVAFKETLKEE